MLARDSGLRYGQEVHVLEKEFLATESLQCTFHVSNHFCKECIKSVYGRTHCPAEGVLQ